MRKIEKSAESVSVIGGMDGPTSVFIRGRGKITLKQKIERSIFRLRKKWYAKRIKPNAHTMDEVLAYVKETYGLEEVGKDTKEYLSQYDSIRASFIMQYHPELLGEYAKIPEDMFPFAFHMLRKTENGNKTDIYLASFDYIGGGWSGPRKKGKDQFQKMFKDIYRYYGVTEEDIKNKTKRYEELLRTLAMRA